MLKPIEIRIKRLRTPTGNSTLERFEKWASIEGRSPANALIAILEGGTQLERWREFYWEQENPGKATN